MVRRPPRSPRLTHSFPARRAADRFGWGACGFLLLVFALPNGFPAPIAPGLSAILGAPLLLLSGQMVLGFDHPWCPKSWLRRSFRRADVARMLRPAKIGRASCREGVCQYV